MDFPLSTKVPNFRNNQSLAAICCQGLLMHSVYRGKPQTELLTSCTMAPGLHCLHQPLQGSLGFIFCPIDWHLPLPIRTAQLHLHLHLYQAELFYNNQLKSMIPINQQHNSDQSERYEFGDLICTNLDQLGTWAGTCSIEGGLPFVLGECTLSFHQRLHFSALQLFHLNKVFFLYLFGNFGLY